MRSSTGPLLWAVATLILMIGSASAQPGSQPVPRRYAPVPYYGPPSHYHLLTDEERELLLQGEISSGQHWGGAIASYLVGFGLGHAVQGRYSDVGWKFTLGGAASLAGIFVGASVSYDGRYEDHDRLDSGERIMIASAVSFVLIRVWELVDAIAGPSGHNRRYRAARQKAYGAVPGYSLFVAPTSQGNGGGVAGLSLRF